MSHVTTPQPNGTPTWIDLHTPEYDRALEFYGALFGWEYSEEPTPSGRRSATCLLRGRPVAAITQTHPQPHSQTQPHPQTTTGSGWTMYIATADCDGTVKRITEAGGTLLYGPAEATPQGARTAIAEDSVGARFGLWQAGTRIGCEIVNEPDSLVRNDLLTPAPEQAREFYRTMFDYTLDLNEDMPGMDFTFLRRPDGHEIGGIFGTPAAPTSATATPTSTWATTFEVADTEAVVHRATTSGGTSTTPEDIPYGRIATITDPTGNEFSVITRL